MPPAAQRPAAVIVTAPPPYTYMGTLQERGVVYVYLQRSGIPYRIAGPGPLDAQYSVEAVEPRRIVLRHLALGTLQEIRLDVAPAAATTITPLAPEPVVLDSEGRPLPIEK